MSRKAVIAGLVAAILLCAPAFAAGGKEAEQAAGTAGKSGVEKYFPLQGKKYTINWVSGASAPVDEDALMVKYWNDAFNVDIKIINIETNKYVELINLRFAAGDIPDRFQISPMSNLIKWKEQDILAEVPREAVEKISPKLYQRLLQTSKSYFDYCSVGGKIYGFRQLRAPNDFRSVALWRRDWLKNVGIARIPETLDEAEAALYSALRWAQREDRSTPQASLAVLLALTPQVSQFFDRVLVMADEKERRESRLSLLAELGELYGNFGDFSALPY